MIVKEIKLYEDRDDVTLTTYITAEKGELHEIGMRPAVIICPGGAYLSCSDREAEPIALSFAAMGYHAFVLRYSTYLEGENGFPDMTKGIEPKVHCQHPAPMREIGKAMLIVRDHAKEWQVDTERIVVCGFSAGAHNSAMYATNWHTPLLSEYYQREAADFRPAAVILGYTLSDYTFMKEASQDEMEKAFFKISNTAFLGEAEPSDEKLKAVSPCMHVTKNTPPAFLWATSADTMVPVQHSIRLAHALADQKIPFEMHIFEEGMHGLATATQASAISKSQISRDAGKWMDLAGCWLEKRFALELPDKMPFE